MAFSLAACAAPAAEEAPVVEEAPVAEEATEEAAEEEPAEKYVLKFNHVLTDKDPFHEAYLKWADAVAERTNGGLTIEVFHSAQLGVEEDIIEQIRAGANVGQNTDSARLGNYVPEIAVMNAPYFVESVEEVQKLAELDTVNGWLDQLGQETGIKVLSFLWVQGFRHMVTNKPIYTPEDLNGLLIRTPGAPIWQESIRALGAEPVALAFSELYTGVQTKVVDGVENVYTSTYSSKLNEVLSYMTETGHILLVNFAVCSQEWFDKLPAEYQTILEEECMKAGLECSLKLMNEDAAAAKQGLIDAGMTILEPEDIDMEAFRAAGEKAYEVLGLTETRDAVWAEMGK
ncbi:MAG: C4-dicarboxylate TRAP transporter substrate-binding protein [Clostridia bacterium]|nr:C4-dicarboxylate TRAP transporter substrate-binding protein [Clostridia bacterium]